MVKYIFVFAFFSFLFPASSVWSQTTPSDLSKYSFIDPGHVVPPIPLKRILAYYDQIRDHLQNKNFVTVVDFTQPSSAKRMYVINMQSGAVTQHLVAHGKGSDPSHTGYATRFSNEPGSDMSSVGMYLVGEEYTGGHGHSLRLRGLESTNSNALARDVVIHSAWYVSPEFSPLGRSNGCPAVSTSEIEDMVRDLRDGSLYYIWATH